MQPEFFDIARTKRQNSERRIIVFLSEGFELPVLFDPSGDEDCTAEDHDAKEDIQRNQPGLPLRHNFYDLYILINAVHGRAVDNRIENVMGGIVAAPLSL